ncbi:MAG: YbgA family protein [Clostridiaceae bacterium]
MDTLEKPIVVVSKCLGFSSCRYNNSMIANKFVSRIKDHVNILTVCPEVEIGLGTPRTPIRLILSGDQIEVYQPTTNQYFTEDMNNFSQNYLNSLLTVDGFLLKGRSPSCGKYDVKVFYNTEKSSHSTRGSGLFAQAIVNKFPYTPFEDEGRITNARIRENFLTKLFTLFNFRKIIETCDISELIKFHSKNTYLLMSYNLRELKILEKILESYNKTNLEETITEYKNHLYLALNKMPRHTTNINTLMHILGYFSQYLSSKEKDFVLKTFDDHKKGKIPLSVPLYILKSYSIQFENQYLLNQTIWCPYPEDLVDISDSAKVK